MLAKWRRWTFLPKKTFASRARAPRRSSAGLTLMSAVRGPGRPLTDRCAHARDAGARSKQGTPPTPHHPLLIHASRLPIGRLMRCTQNRGPGLRGSKRFRDLVTQRQAPARLAGYECGANRCRWLEAGLLWCRPHDQRPACRSGRGSGVAITLPLLVMLARFGRRASPPSLRRSPGEHQRRVRAQEPSGRPARPAAGGAGVPAHQPRRRRCCCRSDGMSFDLTHRFNGNLAQESFSDSLESLFGIDDGATIGLEFRYGLVPRVQVAAYRTSFNRTIQLHGKYDAIRQARSFSGVGVRSRVGGRHRQLQGKLRAGVRRHGIPDVAESVALYAAPVFVHNSARGRVSAETRSTWVLVAGCVSRPTVYVAARSLAPPGRVSAGQARISGLRLRNVRAATCFS